ncbi:MAG: metallophosphoesterase [Candidatus Thorarchaeota archaeon]|nr:metallophosphoesterase [Candidatus Thorarchaeota archaeon]
MNRKNLAIITIGILLTVSLSVSALWYFDSMDSDSLTFYVLGDSQGYQGGLAKVVAAANENNPSMVFHCGDLTPFGQESQYQDVLDTISGMTTPFYTTPGNHDIRLDGRTRYTEHFGESSYSFDLDSAHFSVFDTSEGDVDDETYQWLENDLLNTDTEWKFVFTHIPPFNPRSGENHTLQNSTTASRLMTLFEQANVNVVFSGHIHMFSDIIVNGVRYVITGGAGASLAASEEDGGIYHYVTVKISSTGLEIEPVLLGTPSIDRSHILLKANEEDITLSLDDLSSLTQVTGFSSFENQLGNWRGKGDYVGVLVSDIVEIVGGLSESQNLRIISSDGFEQTFSYANVYPNSSWYEYQGDMILAFQYNETSVPNWADGMRIIMMPADGAYSGVDCLATSAPGQGWNVYPSAGARWVRYVSVIEVIGS